MNMPLSLLVRRRLGVRGAFNPISLFASGEPGVWYDPSDLTTMFQDRAGSTPVTAPGQTVGYVLDKSGRGNHLTANSDAARGLYGIEPLGGRRNIFERTEEFDNAYWTKSGATIGANSDVAPNGTTTADKLIENAGSVSPQVLRSLTTVSGSHTLSCYVKSAGKSWIRLFVFGSGLTGTSAWFNVSTGAAGAVGASVTASSIQSVGDGWYRCAITLTLPAQSNSFYVSITDDDGTGAAYTGDGTSGVLVWGAQLELGSTATDYQKVVTGLEVTEASKRSVGYIFFDGADDGYVTPTITPSTDKVQVFAGVRKLSNAAQQIVAEHGPSSTDGTFTLSAPPFTNGGFAFWSRGTTLSSNAFTGAPLAPVTQVVSGLGEISTDTAILRQNGAQVATSAQDQGTGNYLAYPLYVGRRGGISLPFNGRLYSLIVRFGPNLGTSRIEQVETWVNSKTGAY
jgi:hypothetical protein